MTYETFQTEVLHGLQCREIGNAALTLTKKEKNNGQIRCGIVFSNPVTNTSPTIYLEDYYEFYQTTGHFDMAVDMIADLYRSLPAIQVDEKMLYDFSFAKDRIIMKLINTERNHTFLKTVPHLPFHDLSIVYSYFIGKTDNTVMDMPINDEMLKKWGVDTLTLHRHAMKNYIRLFSVKFSNLDQYLQDSGYTEDEEDAADVDYERSKVLYFLTNEPVRGGAVLMTCKNLMDKIADFFGEDFYIIPSSTHEVLLLPESKSPSKEWLDQMIQEVNQAHVMPEDFLSDHAYYYSKSGQYPKLSLTGNILCNLPGTIS